MVLHDISMTITENMPVYKEEKARKPVLTVTRDFESSSAYESRLEMDMHTGTHIDMPLHFIPGGAASEQWDIDQMFTRCTVLDFTDLAADAITKGDLELKEREMKDEGPVFARGRTVLLKTKNSLKEGFDFSFAYLDKTGAAYLAEKKIAGVGTDALGIERNQPDHQTHKTLLGARIWIVEGLRLNEVPQGSYILAVLPLKVKGAEAVPARAVLLASGSMPLA